MAHASTKSNSVAWPANVSPTCRTDVEGTAIAELHTRATGGRVCHLRPRCPCDAVVMAFDRPAHHDVACWAAGEHMGDTRAGVTWHGAAKRATVPVCLDGGGRGHVSARWPRTSGTWPRAHPRRRSYAAERVVPLVPVVHGRKQDDLARHHVGHGRRLLARVLQAPARANRV